MSAPKRTRQPTPTPTKTCVICNQPFNRKRRKNGLWEHLGEYANRRTCGPSCGAKLARTLNTKHHTPAPCRICNNPIPRRDNERAYTWRARTTCSPECLRQSRVTSALAAADRNRRYTPEERAERDRERKRAHRRKTRNVSPIAERRLPFERFPTPAGLKAQWETVVGEALPPHEWHNAVTSGTPRPANLTTALQAHPALATALAGLLTDSWVPFSRGSGYRTTTADHA